MPFDLPGKLPSAPAKRGFRSPASCCSRLPVIFSYPCTFADFSLPLYSVDIHSESLPPSFTPVLLHISQVLLSWSCSSTFLCLSHLSSHFLSASLFHLKSSPVAKLTFAMIALLTLLIFCITFPSGTCIVYLFCKLFRIAMVFCCVSLHIAKSYEADVLLDFRHYYSKHD